MNNKINKLNISGILKTYSEKCARADSDKQLKSFLNRLKEDLKEEIRVDESNNEQINS